MNTYDTMYTDFDDEDRREGLCEPKVHKQTVVYTEKLLMDISHKISLTECFHNETFKFLLKKTGPKPQLLILSHQFGEGRAMPLCYAR